MNSDAAGRLRHALTQAGLTDRASEILESARPGVRYTLTRGESPLGATRFGGAPDLPPGFAWPNHESIDARFVAQIDLDELAAIMPDNPLPHSGLLSFFWWQEDSYGVDPEGCRVHHFPKQGLRRATDPWSKRPEHIGFFRRLFGAKPSDNGQGWHACTAKPTLNLWLDHLAWENGLSKRFTPQESESLFELPPDSGLSFEGHHILGNAQPIQGAVEVEAELPAGAHGAAAWESAARTASRWRCLLEVTSDGPPGFCFGDWGSVYFMITNDDLKHHRFDRVQPIFQCH
jgi:hypothetical protein